MSQTSNLDNIRNQNLAIVASLTDLSAGILQKVAGNEIANTLEGERIGGNALREMIAAKVGLHLTKQTGGR